MKADKLVGLAVEYCADIYMDFSEMEVSEYPPSIIKAWETGKKITEIRNIMDEKAN